MDKRAKTILTYSFLALIVISAIVFLIHFVVAYTSGSSDLSVNYNLVTEDIAGRHYTPQCLVDCHLPFCVSYSGSAAPSTLAVSTQDINQYFTFPEGVDTLRLKDYGIDYLTTETYYFDVPDYGNCESTWIDLNDTKNPIEHKETLRCVTGSHQEQETRQVWKALKDISQINLEKNKAVCFDIWGKLQPKLGENFAVDVIPSIKLQGNEFIMSEMAWWNADWQNARNITMTNPEAGYHENEYIEVNITGLTLATNNCSKEIVIINNASNQISAQVLSNNTATAGNQWCYVAFLANISGSEKLNYTAYYNNPSASETDEIIDFTANSTENQTKDRTMWTFETDALNSPPSGWIDAGGSAGINYFPVTNTAAFSGTKGMENTMDITTSSSGIGRNFTTLNAEKMVTACFWYKHESASDNQDQTYWGIDSKEVWGENYKGVWQADSTNINIRYFKDTDFVDSGADYPINKWQYFCLEAFNMTNGNIWLSGTKNLTNINFNNVGSSSPSNFKAMVFVVQRNSGMWDDMKIFKGRYYGNNNATYTIGEEMQNRHPFIQDIAISPLTAYTNSILNCSAIYLGVDNAKVDITWYNGSAFYGITSKLDISNGSIVSSLPYGIQNMQDGFSTSAFGSDFPIAITTNGSDFWIADSNDGFVYHVNRTGGNISDGFSTTTFGAGTTVQGITTNGNDFWFTDSTDNFTYHTNKSGYNFSDGFRIGSYILGITTNGTDFWVIDNDVDKIYHTKPNGAGGTINYSDSFSTTSFGSDEPYDLAVRGSDLWIYDMTDKFVYHVKPDGVGGVTNYSDGISVAQTNPFRAITLWPTSYDTSNLSGLTDLWTTDTFSYLVAHKKKVLADVAKGETWNCTIEAADAVGNKATPQSKKITISNSPPSMGTVSISPSLPTTISTLNCSAMAYDADLDSMVLNFTWYNGSAYYNSSTKASSNGSFASVLLAAGIQAIGETWNCSVFVNDSTNNSALNSDSVSVVGYNITFDVRSGEDNSSLNNFNIYCNDSWQVTGVSSPYSRVFSQGNYECEFEQKTPIKYFNATVTFTADSDKTIEVNMSEKAYLTLQEHNWLELIYDCLYNGNCKALDLLMNINQTTTQIWQQVTRTNRDVVAQETFISSTLSSSANITLNYTVQIPFKQGYANGELLPLRMYFWFTNISKTQCYNQDKRDGSQNRAENLYCFPLVAETLGPNNGSVTFTVDLRPNLTAGNYNITRAIEIDPIFGEEQVWTNYGQEDIGQVLVEEGTNEPGINLIKTGETKPSITFPLSSITGAAIQGIKSSLTNKDILVLAGMLTFIISVIVITISITFYKVKKLRYSR
jgi:hypothetical protein